MSGGAGEGQNWESLLESGKLNQTSPDPKVKEVDAMAFDPFGDPLPVGVGVIPQLDPFGDPLPVRPQGSLADPTYSGPVRILSNDSRTVYKRPEPKMKILKRPDPQQTKIQDCQVPKNVMKTLQQREADYAEARQRILGAEAAESKPTPPSKQNGKKAEGSKKMSNGEVRPKGPDGTKGFHRR